MTILQRIRSTQEKLDELMESHSEPEQILALSRDLDQLIEDFMRLKDGDVKN